MCAQTTNSHRSLASSVLSNKCPRCREGNLFLDPNPYHLKTTMHMPDTCPVCGQRFELQTGFYFGTGFVSYGATVFLSGITFVLWWFTLGISIHDNSIFWWLAVNAGVLVLLQPLIQRISRATWIAFFVPYDKNWSIHKSVSL